MLAAHVSAGRMFVLAPVVLGVIAILLGISAIARRRAVARLNRIRAVRQVMTPVRYGPTEGFPMRRFIWGGLVAVAVLATVFLGVVQVRTVERQAAYTEALNVAEQERARFEAEANAVMAPDIRLPDARVPTPPRKSKFWLKADKVAPAEPTHEWKGVIERTAVASLVNSQEEKYTAIRDALAQQLNLRVQPPDRFFQTPAYIKIEETEREPMRHDADIGDYVRIAYKVEVTPLGWQELSRLERADRAGTRMELAARGLGLLTVLLGALAMYVRLDDWTKGYYSGRLFLAAFGLAGVLCAGIACAI